jgi:hydrocephalus-inducing protein
MDFRMVVSGSIEDHALLDILDGRTQGSILQVTGAAAPSASTVSKGKDTKPPVPLKTADKKVATPLSSVEAAARNSDAPISEFGRFFVEPTHGTIPPGASIQVSVRFFACGSTTHKASTRIHVANFDRLSGKPEQLLYELIGESCVPGINSADFASIFEEQVVVPHLYQLGHLPYVGSTAGTSTESSTLFSRTRCGYGIEDNTFSFGSVVHSVHPKGVVERLCLSNPTKISATVSLSIRADESNSGVFQVTPQVMEVPAHESRYVELKFCPTGVKSYMATFLAEVEGGTIAATSKCQFNVRGDGALPTITCLEPESTQRSAVDGCLNAAFARTHAGSTREKPVVVKNTGHFPAVVKVDLSPTRTFQLRLDGADSSHSAPVRSVSMTLQPGQLSRVYLQFSPTTEAISGVEDLPGLLGVDDEGNVMYGVDATISVLHNPFEVEKIRCKASAFIADLIFEGVNCTKDGEDTIALPPVCLGAVTGQSAASFSLVNVCEHPIRFEWPHAAVTAPIAFSPRAGHIPAGGRSAIIATFSPDETVPSSLTVENLSTSLTYSRITYDSSVAKIASDERLKLASEGIAVNRGQPVKVTGRGAPPIKTKESTSKLPTKDTKAVSKGPTTPAKKGDVIASPAGRKRPRIRGPAIVSEPRTTWSEDDTNIAFVSISEPIAQDAISNGSGAVIAGGKEVKLTQRVPEPWFAVIALDDGADEVAAFRPVPAADEAAALQGLVLKVSALADRPRIEFVDEPSFSKSVNFLPTMMLQCRTMPVVVRNSSRIPFNYSWELAHGTFSISPSAGLLEAFSTTQFSAKFAPADAEDYDSVASLLTTVSKQQQLALALHGRGQRPICHIDVPPSDYLSHRALDLPGPTGEVAPLDAATRVVEIQALGTGFRNIVKFFLVNPTAAPYEFVWDAMNTTSSHSSRFRCLTPRGMVMPGKRFEMAFEFTPLAPGTAEAFWRFTIPSCAISQQFLVVGLVREPQVALDRSFLSFRPLLVGAHTSEILYLTNDEEIPLAFEVLALADPVDRSSVTMAVQSGIIPAKGKKPLELSFAPAEERYFNVSMQIAIARKSFPLVLNVKGDGYALHDRVAIEQSEGTMELSSSGVNYLDYGTVQVHERGIKRVVVANTGSFAFDFAWNLVNKRGSGKQCPIRVTPETGKLPKGGQIVCEMEYKPLQEEVQLCTFACTIANTKKYVVQVAGKAVPAALQFSSDSIDFAQCFCPPSASMPSLAVTKLLRVSNRERDRDISLQCLFAKKPYLEVLFDAAVIRSGQTVDIPVVFTPRMPVQYSETLLFEINGLQTVSILMRGEGVAPILDVYPASAAASAGVLKELAFGIVKPAHATNRAFKLANSSSKAVWVEFVTSEEELTSKCISVSRKPFVIKGGDFALVDVTFSPSVRVAHFRLPLMIRMAAAAGTAAGSSLSEPWELVMMTGACLGMDVSLEVDTLNFGLVCEGSKLTRQIMLYNSGDLPAIYRWKGEMFGKHFSIHPVSGVVAARSDVALYVTFAPKEVRPDLRADKVELAIEGMKPLQLSMTGDCVPKPAASGAVVNFACKVRESSLQNVPLPRNDTDKPWTITPIILNDYWSGALSVEIPAKSTCNYAVTYRPLTMTREPTTTAVAANTEMQIGLPAHSGSIFFPFPDGTGLTVALQGKAAAPSNVAQVVHKCLAKKPLTFSVPITNWLRSTQTFEITWDPKTIPAHAQLKAAKAIDVPGMASRDLKMTFIGLLEGKVSTNVVFTNPHTGEYVCNDLLFEVGPAGITAELSLESVVRQCVSTFITIENPLAETGAVVAFSALTCDHPAIRVVKVNDMTGQREGRFKLEYRPLVPTTLSTSRPGTAPATSRPATQPAGKTAAKPDKEKDKVDDKAVAAAASAAAATYARVSLHSDQLGDYLYDLKLKAVPAGFEPALRFNSQLGSRQTLQYKIKHYEFKAGNYKCSVSRPDLFSVPPSISVPVPASAAEAWDGVDCVVDVTFEGTSVGEVSAELVVASDASGTFVAPLVALCAEPRPTGPFMLAPSGSMNIDFRNVFNEDREFFISTDNPALFTCAPVGLTRISRKSSMSISIKYNGAAGSADASGRLAVSLAGAHDSPPWIFYLRGSSDAAATSTVKGTRAPSAGKSGSSSAPKKK